MDMAELTFLSEHDGLNSHAGTAPLEMISPPELGLNDKLALSQ